jgi:hypothetical protein
LTPSQIDACKFYITPPFTSVLSVGFIVNAGACQHISGRIRTAYIDSTSLKEGQYHELVPMRFLYEIVDWETNKTFLIMDQRMIFQLEDVLNELNMGNETMQMKFWD